MEAPPDKSDEGLALPSAPVVASEAPTQPIVPEKVKHLDPGAPNYETEKQEFYTKLFEFLKKRGQSSKAPRIGRREIDLYLLYNRVLERGGLNNVLEAKCWKEISGDFQIPASCTNAGYMLRKNYMKYLWAYEQVFYWGKPEPPLIDDSVSNYYPPGFVHAKDDHKAEPEKRKMEDGLISFQLNSPTTLETPSAVSHHHPHYAPTEPFQPPAPEDIYRHSKRRDTGGIAKLHVALESPIASHRKWALDLLTPMSYASDLRLTQYGLVLDALVALLSESLAKVRTDPVVEHLRSASVDVGSVLASPGSPLECVRRVLTILRNASMVEESDRDLANHPTLPQLLFECILAATRDPLASRLALELLANFAHLLSDENVLEFLPLVGHLLRAGDQEERSVVIDALRRLVAAQRIDAQVLREKHPETGRSPFDDLVDLFVFGGSREIAVSGAEIFYALSREEASCNLLSSKVQLLRKLLENVQSFVVASDQVEADEEFAKRCALILVNLSKVGPHRKFLVCFEGEIANLVASTHHVGLSPILFNLLTNVST